MDVNPPHPPLQGTERATIGSNAFSVPSQLPRKRLAISTDMGMGEDGKPRSRETFQKTFRDKLVMAIIENDLPLSFSEYEGFREMLNYINPDVEFVSRNTIVGNMRTLYMSKKESLKQELANIPGRVCVTYNVWTACTTEEYICLTAHYVDSTFTLCNKILGFSNMPYPQSEYESSRKVIDILKDWGIEKRVFSITLDNASGNIGMQDMLKEQLCIQNNLLCNGQFFHVPCFAHILNLIVQEGLEVINDVLLKIRQSVVYVKWLKERMKKFEECVKNLQIEGGVHLHLDVPNRWNSSFMMLESALKYKSAFARFQEEDENYKYCPSSHEWERGEKMLEFLRPFNDVTNLISSSTPPTSNIYFTEVWYIECKLIENANNEDDTIRDMAIRMKIKFDEYWGKYSVVFALGAVLDPRMKFTLLEHCYNKVDPTTCQLKLEVVRRKLFQLYDAYVSSASSSSSQTKSPNISRPRELALSGSGRGLRFSSFMALQDIENQIAVSATAGKSQLGSLKLVPLKNRMSCNIGKPIELDFQICPVWHLIY